MDQPVPTSKPRKLSKLERDYAQMWLALRRITRYQSSGHMSRHSERDWACGYQECLEMAYDNVQTEARNGLKGVRKPQ